jgi:hypothetical protein
MTSKLHKHSIGVTEGYLDELYRLKRLHNDSNCSYTHINPTYPDQQSLSFILFSRSSYLWPLNLLFFCLAHSIVSYRSPFSLCTG